MPSLLASKLNQQTGVVHTSRKLPALLPAPAQPLRSTRPVLLRASADASISVSTSPPQNGVMPSSTSTKDDVKGAMLEPSVVNTSWVRTLAMTGAVVAAASSSAVLPSQWNAFIHVISYGLLLGTNIWNTFFVGLTMFKHMPRQTFGRVQAALFPKYFFLTTASFAILLGSRVLTAVSSGASVVAAPGVITLGLGLAASLGNAAYVEPIATKLMFARYEIENKENKSEEDKAEIQQLYKQFGKFHGISSLLNLIASCTILAYGWTLAGGMSL